MTENRTNQFVADELFCSHTWNTLDRYYNATHYLISDIIYTKARNTGDIITRRKSEIPKKQMKAKEI